MGKSFRENLPYCCIKKCKKCREKNTQNAKISQINGKKRNFLQFLSKLSHILYPFFKIPHSFCEKMRNLRKSLQNTKENFRESFRSLEILVSGQVN